MGGVIVTWTTFANLTTPTLPELDANLAFLNGLVNIPCTVSGTNTLTVTPVAGGGTISSYSNYMVLRGIAAATNSGAVTANFAGIGALNVYKDTPAGPVVLTGNEIVLNCEFSLIYDSTLNASAGGFHLDTPNAGGLSGQTVTVASINATLGSLTSLSISNGYFASASIATLSVANGYFASASIATLSVANGIATLSSVQLGSVVNALTRLQSTLASFSITSGNALTPGQEAQATISFTGAAVNDQILVQPSSVSASLSYAGYVSAAGSVVFRVHNLAPAATVTVSLFTVRLTDIGFNA